MIDQDTMRHAKLRATADGRTIRSLIEETFYDWLVRNPVDHKALKTAIR